MAVLDVTGEKNRNVYDIPMNLFTVAALVTGVLWGLFFSSAVLLGPPDSFCSERHNPD